jgi:hypothetical protein
MAQLFSVNQGRTAMHHSDVLKSAQSIVNQRGNEYGDLSSSFVRASTIASAISGKPISSYDIAIVMMAVKMSRIGHNKNKADSWVDLVNYTTFAAQFADEEPDNVRKLNIAETKQNIADAVKADAS